jgi:hypothetical protein
VKTPPPHPCYRLLYNKVPPTRGSSALMLHKCSPETPAASQGSRGAPLLLLHTGEPGPISCTSAGTSASLAVAFGPLCFYSGFRRSCCGLLSTTTTGGSRAAWAHRSVKPMLLLLLLRGEAA